MEKGPRHRVVVVGAGFGGLACARKLDGEPVDVPGDANQRMRDLMGKLAVVMQHDFAFGDPLPGASDPMDNPL
ncbi:MAG: hypothetical protein ACRD1H_10045, partial [Vicinamibacterales bacterium]